MTMEQLAEAVGVSKSYIWALENNPEQRVQRTSATVMNNLAKALGVNLLDLMGEAPPEALGETPTRKTSCSFGATWTWRERTRKPTGRCWSFSGSRRTSEPEHEKAGHGRSQSGDQGGPLDRAVG
jgi:transcriptional regulator with XRE-family HTH domain